MSAKIVGLVRKGGMRERRAENRLFNDIQSYHPTWREFGLTKVTLKEGYPAVARIELANTTTAKVFSCVPGAQPVGKRTRKCTLSRIFLSLYEKDRRLEKASCFMCGGQRWCRKCSLPGWWYPKGTHTTDGICYLGSHE